LPIGPTGTDNSPYRCLSAFAGNPLLIDAESLHADGLLSRKELDAYYRTVGDGTIGDGSRDLIPRVDYDRVRACKLPLLYKAVSRMADDGKDYRRFCTENAYWLDDFADMAVQKEKIKEKTKGETDAKRLQYLFFSQWAVLKGYANARGIGIVGDLPFYVSEQSADFAAHPELFRTVRSGKDKGAASDSAGVPPDAFSEDGQVWNTPVYEWHAHKKDNYRWWMARLRQAAALYDLCRIDHFRGLSAYFSIPSGQPASAGRWERGPGEHFVDVMKKSVPGLKIIAEDLGILTDDLCALLRYSGFPGMKVLQFAFDPNEESEYLPHNHIRNCMVYTGTHDNDTLIGWVHDSKPDVVKYTCDYLGVAARINTPSTVSARNWSFRLAEGQLTETLAERMRGIAKMYGRIRE
jgi:4-alpha-glucanotransferase